LKPASVPLEDSPDQVPEIRQRIITVPESAMLDCLSGRLKISNLPEGTRLISTWIAGEWDGLIEISRHWCLRIEHASLPLCAMGAKLPTHAAIIERGRK
jgi:hypothetical protein